MAQPHVAVDMNAATGAAASPQAAAGTKSNDTLFGPNIGVLGTGPDWTERPDKSEDVLTPEVVKNWIAKSKDVSASVLLGLDERVDRDGGGHAIEAICSVCCTLLLGGLSQASGGTLAELRVGQAGVSEGVRARLPRLDCGRHRGFPVRQGRPSPDVKVGLGVTFATVRYGYDRAW